MRSMSASAPTLRRLGEEPFGYQLRRARMASGMQLREAAKRISVLMLTTHTSLNRLEKLTGPPTDRSRRALAYLAMLCYGFDPADLGLNADDLPKGFAQIGDLESTLRASFPGDGKGAATSDAPSTIRTTRPQSVTARAA